MNFYNINHNLYKTFLSVYEAKNITRAAEHLSLVKSGVIKNIRSLENQLNVTLFIAKPRGVVPTKEATELYKLAKPAFAALNNAESIIKEFNQNSTGVLRIGCPSHFARGVLLGYFCRFKKDYPNFNLEINSKSKYENIELLSTYDIDVLITAAPIKIPNKNLDANFKKIELLEMKNTFFTSVEFAKKNKLGKKLTKRQLETLPILLPSKTFNTTKVLIEKLKAEMNTIIETSSSAEVAFGMVLSNMGIGYAVEDYVDCLINDKIVKLSAVGDLPTTTLAVAFNKDDKSKPVHAFVNGLIEYCNEHRKTCQSTQY